MARQTRSDRVAVADAYAELASSFVDVLNVSRTGVLIRTAYEQQPGDEWPLILELSKTPIRLLARVVRCEPVRVRRKERPLFALGLTFVDPSKEAQAVLDRVCRDPSVRTARQRRFCISFVRRCPVCKSRAVAKEGRYTYVCSSCDHNFSGMRIGIIRFAR